MTGFLPVVPHYLPEMSHLLIAESPKPVDRLSRIANHLPFEESDVETRRVIVHELKEEHLQRQAVLVLRFGPRQLCSTQNETLIYLEDLLNTFTSEITGDLPKSVIQMATFS